MLDFVSIKTSTKVSGPKDMKEAVITVYPEFLVQPSEDLMIRGRAFYAVWDEDNNRWSTDEGVVMRIVDDAVLERCQSYPDGVEVEAKLLRNFSSKKWTEFLNYCGSLPDNYHELDNRLVFSDEEVHKEDYATKSLPYPLKAGDCKAYSEIMETLYDPIERQKLEWAIGAVVSGDSRWIQKFVVLYGEAGSGKSTVLNIIGMLFEGYSSTFEAKALGQSSNAFALEAFSDNPLVSIQHDGDLSRIEDNTKLNSIVSHESLMVNEKYKRAYPKSFNTFLFMGTNKPVKITDAKSGIVRRLIDVSPSGKHIPFDRYQTLMAQVRFELGAIASHCLDVYLDLGPNAYDAYRPLEMMSATNDFYNFMEDNYDRFQSENGATLNQVWESYKQWCDDTAVRYPMGRRGVQEELKEYFDSFVLRRKTGDGHYIRNVYTGFREDKFNRFVGMDQQNPMAPELLELNSWESIFDQVCADYPAQLAKPDGTPSQKWDNVTTTLKDLDTHELHYVRVPENHIVIDFDIPDDDGNKDLTRNLRAASKWPATYAELSKSGAGVHLHYIYEGDVAQLSPKYDDHIEVKVFTGKSSLRRQLTRCNDIPIATLSSGLPRKKGGDSKVIDFEGIKNEAALRTLIENNCRKRYVPGTKPSIDLIFKDLESAYNSGMHYDVSDMMPKVQAFALNSTHNSLYCMKKVSQMHFHSDEPADFVDGGEDGIIFYDVEVFPNLFVIVYKQEGDHAPIKMINPTPSDVEILMRKKLVGFNCRRYDNHILYARLLGYSNLELYGLSQDIISNRRNAMFREAYNVSYTDIYDFSSKKQSLKKFEIELGIHHQELGLPWDQPVPENLWEKVADYCINDVLATEATFKARYEDFEARCLLADLSGLSVNDTTRQHATKIIFGNDRNPQKQFNYVDLSEYFPGYKYEAGVSTYRGDIVGEGGRVWAKPGMYFGTIKTFDVGAMHPHSIIAMKVFGKYTKNFEDLVNARMAIKHGDYEAASKMLDGKLAPYLKDKSKASALSYALKIINNSVYGYTKASFDCEFRDPRNVDNIVAKRGALFMMDLHAKVEEMGGEVLHIKTDSIKILNPTPEIEEFIYSYGKEWGYTFEVESVYSRFCLVNDAVYIAKEGDHWSATGAQFAVPYVFKTLFSHEDLVFDDFCETKSVTGTSKIYLDMNEDLGDEHAYKFVGNVGRFCPVKAGHGGGLLMREKDGKYYAVGGTKGYRWLESEVVANVRDWKEDVDVSYYEALADKAVQTLAQFGNVEEFVKE